MKKNGDNIFEKIYKFLSSFLVGCDTVVVISIHVISKKNAKLASLFFLLTNTPDTVVINQIICQFQLISSW